MARRFFFVSLGILALSIAYHLGAARAAATATTNSTGLVGVWGERAFTAAGEAWKLREPGWTRQPEFDLPVPVGQIAFIDGGPSNTGWLVTTSGEGWINLGSATWVSIGQFPGDPTPTNKASWGEVKGSFAR